ncbi:copper chaperone PCu(A)C [Sphingomonas sp. ID1715]|uniref:copper chaperone PCu(A)C n=1 Tax=Sphingomonas sp. ID1715 TaxID=1656898 RepID=UPI0018382981|nr:copper chaperone PCu(A)C [Sphingomonas sp. ID1715]NNM75776.1 copper chaperone PCu(A)C [Sphingomonas sp. ID1715]
MIRTLPILLLAALTACSKEEQLSVTDAYVRFSPVRENPSAAYFTIHGGPQDVSLIGVSTEVAIRSEMHESMAGMNGMAGMKPVTNVQVPAGSEVKFEPGGKHVMLWNINPGIKPPKRITLTFSFSNGERIQADAPLVAAGQEPPKGS